MMTSNKGEFFFEKFLPNSIFEKLFEWDNCRENHQLESLCTIYPSNQNVYKACDICKLKI